MDQEEVSFEKTRYHGIGDLYGTEMIGRTVKVRVHVKEWEPPFHYPYEENGNTVDTLVTTLLLEDVKRKAISTASITDEALVKKLINEAEKYTFLDLLATVVTLRASNGLNKFHLLVHDSRASNRIAQIAEIDESDRAEAERLISELSREKRTIMEFIKTELTDKFSFNLGHHLLELGIEGTILQAFSEGWYESTPARIHTLAVGSPGVGKKLMAQAAWYINPMFTEAHPTKISAAGLNGAARMEKGNKWVSEPGLIPEAHKGTFILQDFHAVRASQRNAALDTFSMVMEDGQCIDSTAAKTTHPAETSIHVDKNKITDLFPEKEVKGFAEDVNIPMNVLSRFDFIIDFPRDAEPQITTMLERFTGGTKITVERPRDVLEPAAMRIRKLVAILRDKHGEVNVAQGIRSYARKKFEELRDANVEHLKDLPLLSDFMQRMHNSVHKFMTAHATMEDRSFCENKDVDVALRFIAEKMAVLKKVQSELKIPKGWEIPRGRKIAEWITEEFSAGSVVTVKKVRESYEKHFGIALDERTAQRWLRKTGTQVRKGSWKLRPRIA